MAQKAITSPPSRQRKRAVWLGGAAAALVIALPVLGQESILPPGFDPPPATRPAPAPTPGPGASPAPRPAPSPRSPAPRPAGGASAPTPAPTPAPSSGGETRPTPRPQTLPPLGTAQTTADLPDDLPLGEGGDADLVALPPPPPRYDLPPGSRRLLTRVGPLTPETGGLSANAFGPRGQYTTILMERLDQPMLSRWSSILLRRALLSGVDTPPSVNGADFAAARALLLLRMGEANGARMMVQSVDIDKSTPRLRSAALQVFIANADPAGLCPYVPAMDGPDRTWNLVKAMCSAMVGEPGSANAVVEAVRRSGALSPIDVKLAEKIVGAGANSRRAAIVRWDDVTQLTVWRFGLGAASGAEIPANLWATATPAMRSWALQLPMVPVEQRMQFAATATDQGVLSARSYVDLVSFAASRDDPPDTVDALAEQVRNAFILPTVDGRVTAIAALAGSDGRSYAGRVLGARAAARIGPVDLDDARLQTLIAAMLSGGLDRNAMAWAPRTAVGSQAWGLLAVGSPRPLATVTARRVDDFGGSDDSTNGLRTRFLAAALVGLGRVDSATARELGADYRLALGTQSSWTRAIDDAARRGEAGTVALLAATGLQGRGWEGVAPYHIFHITRALRQVGLGAEARMIAAEAMTRV